MVRGAALAPWPERYCESAPSGPFFGQQGRKLAPEDATAVVVVEKLRAVKPARCSLVEKCRRRHRQERRHEVEPPAAPGSTEKIGDSGQSRVHVCAGKRGFNCYEECNEQGDAPRGVACPVGGVVDPEQRRHQEKCDEELAPEGRQLPRRTPH